MADDRNQTMLPLSRVPYATSSDDITSEDVIVSSRVQNQVQELGALLPLMIEVLPSAVLVVDERHRMVVANAAARRLLSEDEVPFVGYSVGRFLSLEKLEAARVSLLSRSESVRYVDTVFVRGVEREVEIRLEFVETAGREFLCATLSDETHNSRVRAESTEGRSGAPPPSSRIDHAHQLEALGHLTGSLAHDFNNLLSVIASSLESAERRITVGKDPLADVKRAMTAAQRSMHLTSGILRYARNRTQALEPICPAKLIGDLSGLIEQALGEHVNLIFDIAQTRWVRVGPAQLETAILNLVINARDAVEDGGDIRVVLRERDLDDVEAIEYGLLPGAHVCIGVVDSGQGMTDDVKQRVFEPFYTTKPEGRGTGLGLSTVRSVAQKYAGAVILDSAVGHGTHVTMLFPAV